MLTAPSMILNSANVQSFLNITIQHRLYQLDRRLGHDPGDAEFVVEDLVDAVEGVFFVDEGVEEDSEGPDVLFFAAVGFPLEDFGGGVVWKGRGVR